MAIAKVEERRNIVGSVFLFYVVAMLVVFPLFLIVAWFSDWGGQITGPLFLLFSGMFLFELSIALLQGAELFKVFTAANILNSLIFLLWVLLDGQSGIGFSRIVFFKSTSFLASCAFGLSFLIWKHRPAFTNSWATFRRLFRFGWAVWLNNLQTIVFLRLDVFLVSYFLGGSSVATLVMARRIPMALRNLFQSLRTVLFPRLSALYAENREAEVSQLIHRMTFGTMGTFTVMALIAWFFAQDIITLLFSERYLEASSPFALFMTSLIVALGSNILGTAVMCSGNSLAPTLVNTVTAVCNVGLNVVLIPRMGVTGAALAALIASAVSLPLNYAALRREQITRKLTR